MHYRAVVESSWKIPVQGSRFASRDQRILAAGLEEHDQVSHFHCPIPFGQVIAHERHAHNGSMCFKGGIGGCLNCGWNRQDYAWQNRQNCQAFSGLVKPLNLYYRIHILAVFGL